MEVNSMKREIKTKEKTMEGYVVATDWDEYDNVIEVSIQTEDEEYVVDLSNAFGREMFDFLDQEIEVTGVVKKGKNGVKIINVTDFEELDEEDIFRYYDWKSDFDEEEDMA
jgi:hypothetical protein